jgi:CubicO group peptidase (beta-lactamase class C family)
VATLPHSGRRFDARTLDTLDGWRAAHAAAVVLDRDGLVAVRGAARVPMRWASVSKLLTAYVTLIGIERGVLTLDDAAGPPGATVRHLLAHASGYAFDDTTVLSPPGRTRIYSNAGFDALGEVVTAHARRPFQALIDEWVLGPLGMESARLLGRPSQGVTGTLDDLGAFTYELLAPRLLPPSTLAAATTVAFPGLRGVLPGFGRFDPMDWGLGFELKDGKVPHWTGTTSSPRTFGHFGGSGTFLWVDPAADVAVACLTDREFGPWALEAWPALSDAVLAAAVEGGASPMAGR